MKENSVTCLLNMYKFNPQPQSLTLSVGQGVWRLWAGTSALAKHYWGILMRADGHP